MRWTVGATLFLLMAVLPAMETRGEPVTQARKLTVKITEPNDNDFVFGKTRITATVEAGSEIRGVRVEFSVGGKLVFIDKEPPFELFHDLGGEPRSWVIEAAAIAADGEQARDTIVTRKLTIDYLETVDRVVLSASVTDDRQRFVVGLTPSDFSLFEDDQPQTITDFAEDSRPLTLALLVDSSGSMREEIAEVHKAAVSFVETLRPVDQGLVIDFDENVYMLQDLTSDQVLLRKALEGTDAEGGTAFYDAIFAAYRRLREVEGRRAIVLLTDGEDTNSRVTYKRVLELCRSRDIMIYSIGLGVGLLDTGVRGTLKQIAEDTGGKPYYPSSAEELGEVYQLIAQDLQSQYLITYAPTNRTLDGSWRKIRLETRAKEARIKTRKGYYAVQQ